MNASLSSLTRSRQTVITVLRIGIIGAGIGGLSAAVALHRAGFEVDVYEQAAELTEVGGGINMGPNAVRVLRRLGLGAGSTATAYARSSRISAAGRTGARFRRRRSTRCASNSTVRRN